MLCFNVYEQITYTQTRNVCIIRILKEILSIIDFHANLENEGLPLNLHSEAGAGENVNFLKMSSREISIQLLY